MFCAFIPIPLQMLLVAVLAIIFRFNILVAVPMVWLSNPLTIAPIYYFCYRVGVATLDVPIDDFNFELSMDWFATGLGAVWQPFLLGCFLVAAVSAFLSFVIVEFFWRYHLLTRIKDRRARKIKNKTESSDR